MTTAINWHNIRQNSGSINSGFEELICQLAHAEAINNATFTRVGTPDGGVESYWQLQNSEEYGWQAKYFTAWGSSQWTQIKKSLATAFNTHSKLVRYYICTPLDRPDARISQQKSAMEHWNDLVCYANSLAKKENRKFELIYWGNHELVSLLSKPINSGLLYYWFNHDDFSTEWFSSHIDRSICDLGPRYTPEVNVKQEISQYFDALRQNRRCYELQEQHFNDFLNVTYKSLKHYQAIENAPSVKKLRDDIERLTSLYYDRPVSTHMEETEIGILIQNIRNWLHNTIERLNAKERLDSKDNPELRKSYVKSAQEVLMDIQRAIWHLDEFLDSHHVKCFNKPAILLCGNAGVGKSHLIADVAHQCIKEGIPAILLLGQQFTATTSPWQQIIHSQLRLSCSNENTLLGAINTLGMLHNQRILFMIDAINEGAGRQYWPNYLAGFINEFKKYPYIALVISIRSSYLDCFRDQIGDSLHQINHLGFDEANLFQATEIFFKHYGIEQPNAPLLNPEFNNPLFLKLFCSGLQKDGYTSVPKGMSGLEEIFNFYLKASAKAIYLRNNLDSMLNIVPSIIDALALYMIEQSTSSIPYVEAAKIINAITSQFGINPRNLLQELIAEGILSADISYDSAWNPFDVIRFTYERLGNLIKAQILLKNVSNNDLQKAFSRGGVLSSYLQDTGMLETLSIIIPEKYNCELYQLFDDTFVHQLEIAKAFLFSLQWRKHNSIKIENDKEFINDVILNYQDTFSLFIETIYAVATDAKHPYNANLLHEWLCEYKFAKRDSFWSINIAKNYYSDSNISRLIDWCDHHLEKLDISEQARLLAGIALSWLLTATNNSLRDNATLALTKLLTNHLNIARELLMKFDKIDDPYIKERIFAAVYGATLNSTNLSALHELSQWIADNFFNQDEVYPHILVRDYARNIIEYACLQNVFSLRDKAIITPPYKSYFPKRLPGNNAITKYQFDYNNPAFKDIFWSQNAIVDSMVTEYGRGIGGYGDFGRYVFQARLNAWDQFEVQKLSNYACSLIFKKYGYNVKLHGEFDRNDHEPHRERQRIERIGKKYQWIAMYEVAARLSDNYPIDTRATRWSDKKEYENFSGPWEPFFRNIDPTYLWDRATAVNLPKEIFSYNRWGKDAISWTQKEDDFPPFEKFIEYTDDENVKWIVMGANLSWRSTPPLGQDEDELRQWLQYCFHSCFVRNSDFDLIWQWLQNNYSGEELARPCQSYQIFLREYYWSPAYKFFDGSYYYGHELWQAFEPLQKKSLDGPMVMPTTAFYLWEYEAKDNVSHAIPCKELVTFFNLVPGNHTGEWINPVGEVIYKDCKIEPSEKSCSLIRKDKLIDFLEQRHLKIIWSCLGDKSAYTSSYHYSDMPLPLEIAGTYILKNSKIKGVSKIIHREKR